MSDADEFIQASSGESIFAPESLADIRCRLSFIEASECNCAEGPHENALHDLAYDDVPVLLKVVDQLDAELKTTRAQLDTLRAGLTRVEHFARIQALSERVRTGPAHSTYHCEERYWLDLLALIERAEVTDV